MNKCPSCGLVRGFHNSVLQGCTCQWQMQSTQEKCRIENVTAKGTLLPKRKCENCGEFGPCCQQPQADELAIAYMDGLYQGEKKREWVGLTDEEIDNIEFAGLATPKEKRELVGAIEVKLKEKNT